MPFRWEHITLAERIELGCTCLLYAGQYGLVSELAEAYGTSRQSLDTLPQKTQTAWERALSPGAPGRPRLDQRLVVDSLARARAILVLNQVAHASVRAIQECLGAILHVERSLGAIHAVLAEAAQRAHALMVVPEQPTGALADEIFVAHRPVLEVVEAGRGAVLTLAPTPSRDETAWGCPLLDLAETGVRIDRLSADGAEGLRAGVRAVGLAEPHLDHGHTLRDRGRIAHLLEHTAYRQLARAERAQQAAAAEAHRQVHGHRPHRGRPLKVASDLTRVAQAIQGSGEAIRRADGAAIIRAAGREALRPGDQRTERRRTAAATLLWELGGRAQEAARLLGERAAGLVAYLAALAARLQAPRTRLGDEVVSFLAWAWQHRRGLGLVDAADAWPPAPELAREVRQALEQAVRATGMVETLNSILAFHRAAHRGLPANALAVFAVYRNPPVFTRGTRADHSPLELLGLPSPDWLTVLGYGLPEATSAEFPVIPTETVNTLAA